MTALALLSMFVAVTAGSWWVVFPSPVSFAAAVVALSAMWLIERASCARQIRRVQAEGGVVNYVALRCIGYATAMTGMLAVIIIAMRIAFAWLVEAPAP